MINFHNENAYRAFPLASLTASRRVGGYEWRDGIIVDCGFVVQGTAGDAVLSRVRVMKPKVVFEFALGGRVATLETDYTDPVNTVYRLRNEWADGYLVTGPEISVFSRFADTPTGYYLVSPESHLEPSRIQWLYNAFVDEIRVANRREDTAEAELVASGFTGDVGFSPGMSSFIAADAATGRLHLGTDFGKDTPCWPEGDADGCAGFVTAINGAGPDAGGDFTLAGGKNVEVRNYPEQHRIVIDFTKGLSDEACAP